MSGEHLDAHPAHLAESLAFRLNVSVGPAEHLNDATLLTVLVGCILVNSCILPNKVGGLGSDCELCTTCINSLDNKCESLSKRVACIVSLVGSVAFVVPVILHIGNAAVLATACLNGGRLAITGVGDVVVADDTAHALVALLPAGGAWQGSLESAVDPVSGIRSHGATCAAQILEVRTVGLSESDWCEQSCKYSRV